jgi:hypothetical protein
MTDCPTCEYHKQRAQIWRDEAYRLAGHPLPRKETMTDFLHTDARWTEHFVEVNDPHKEGHHVRFYFEPPQRTWVDLTKEECFELCVKHKDNSFSLLVAVQEKLMGKNT